MFRSVHVVTLATEGCVPPVERAFGTAFWGGGGVC
jgi:hypothetical protein